jgi:phosphatidylserine/phosphatidylglycerophosphate/cardiolipin synthase-like enzyme
VSRLVGLVPLAELLASLAGSRHGATTLALEILKADESALPRGHDDLFVAARHELVATGVLTEAGVPSPGRAAELVTVCELLAASTLPSPAPPAEARLVLSAPPGTVPLLDRERLDALVLDVIRQATDTLAIGGAFWNEAGFEVLEEVLLPALSSRRVAATIYVNTPDPEHSAVFERRLEALGRAGAVKTRWFSGPRPLMLHAKFVVRDRVHGYLGTANLTSWGMSGHIEAGVELTPGQSERFVTFLEQLEAAGMFADSPGGRDAEAPRSVATVPQD